MENEKRLIDANALMDVVRQHEYSLATKQGSVDYGMFTLGIQQAVDEQPTVDAVEVVHGYWIDSYAVDHMGRITEHSIDCSVCDSVFKDDSREVVKHWKERFEVCPFCGAIMDGGNEDVV